MTIENIIFILNEADVAYIAVTDDINVHIAENVINSFWRTEETLSAFAIDEHIEFLCESPVQIGNNGGDMTKSIYDTNFNGLVDTCEYVDGGTF